MREALGLFEEAGDVSGVVLALDDFIELAVLKGDSIRALTLSGAAAALENKTGVELASAYNQVIHRVRPGSTTGPQGHELSDSEQAAFRSGEAMTLEQS